MGAMKNTSILPQAQKFINPRLMEVIRIYQRSTLVSSLHNYKLLQETGEQSRWTIGLIHYIITLLATRY